MSKVFIINKLILFYEFYYYIFSYNIIQNKGQKVEGICEKDFIESTNLLLVWLL